jgi:hypothetical protein
MVIEELQLPSNTPTPLDGEQNSSISQEGMNFVFSTIITHACTLFNCHLMMGVFQKVIKVFRLPKGGAHVVSFLKKNSPPPPHPPNPFRQLKNFSCHLMVGVCWMAIKTIQSPSNTPSLFDGDQIFLVIARLVIEIRFQSPFVTRATQMLRNFFVSVFIDTTNVNMMQHAKCPHHFNFDNPT